MKVIFDIVTTCRKLFLSIVAVLIRGVKNTIIIISILVQIFIKSIYVGENDSSEQIGKIQPAL